MEFNFSPIPDDDLPAPPDKQGKSELHIVNSSQLKQKNQGFLQSCLQNNVVFQALKSTYHDDSIFSLYDILVEGRQEHGLIQFISYNETQSDSPINKEQSHDIDKNLTMSEASSNMISCTDTISSRKRKYNSHNRHKRKRQRKQQDDFIFFLKNTIVVLPSLWAGKFDTSNITESESKGNCSIDTLCTQFATQISLFSNSNYGKFIDSLPEEDFHQSGIIELVIKNILEKGIPPSIPGSTTKIPERYYYQQKKLYQDHVLTFGIDMNTSGFGVEYTASYINTTVSHVTTHQTWITLSKHIPPSVMYFLFYYCSIFCNTNDPNIQHINKNTRPANSNTVFQVSGPAFDVVVKSKTSKPNSQEASCEASTPNLNAAGPKIVGYFSHPLNQLTPDEKTQKYKWMIKNAQRVVFRKAKVLYKKPYLLNQKVFFGFNQHCKFLSPIFFMNLIFNQYIYSSRCFKSL